MSDIISNFYKGLFKYSVKMKEFPTEKQLKLYGLHDDFIYHQFALPTLWNSQTKLYPCLRRRI